MLVPNHFLYVLNFWNSSVPAVTKQTLDYHTHTQKKKEEEAVIPKSPKLEKTDVH